MRTSKTLTKDGTTDTVKYVYEGGLLRQMLYNNLYFEFFYDVNGSPVSMTYRMSPTATPSYYYYGLNSRGDVIALYNSSGNLLANYSYDAYGKCMSVTTPAGAPIPAKYAVPNLNPLRYRGYVYDTETGFYYLQSRYYDPTTCRFINADVYYDTGQGFNGLNMFAYCINNPVMNSDPTGMCAKAWETGYQGPCPGFGKPGCMDIIICRNEVVNAPDLDVNTASSGSYNCYGNGIGKEIVANPFAYLIGDSTRTTFEKTKLVLGSDNVRELNSINDPIGVDEFKVALKCGPSDYHYIRLDGNNWYNKSGTAPGLYVDQSIVTAETWYALFMLDGTAYIDRSVYYDDETIYFAVKIGWDEQ